MKGALLETTRYFLALERAADLGATGIAIAELAQEFGVNAAGLSKFLQVIDGLAPGEAAPEELVDWELDEAGHLTVHYAPGLDREIPLSGDEASALLIGLDRLGLPQRRLDRLRQQLLVRLGRDEAERLLLLRGRLTVMSVHRWREQLEAAVADQRSVKILYESDSGRSWRRVQPSVLIDNAGLLYLGAWCFTRRAPRLFRADRIEELQACEAGSDAGEMPGRAELLKRLRGLSDGHLSEAVKLRPVSADDRWMIEEYFGDRARRRGDHYIVQRFPGQALAKWIVSCAGRVVVESPPALVQRVRARAIALRQELFGDDDDA